MPIDFTIDSNLPTGNFADDDSVSALLIITNDSLGATIPAFFIASIFDDVVNAMPAGVALTGEIQLAAKNFFECSNKTLIIGLMTDVDITVTPITDVLNATIPALIDFASSSEYTIKQSALLMTEAFYGTVYNTTATDFGYMLLEDTGAVIKALILQNAKYSAKRKPIVWYINGYANGGNMDTIRPVIDPAALVNGEPASGVGIIIADANAKMVYLGIALGLMARLPVRENIGGHQRNDIHALLGTSGTSDEFTNGELVALNYPHWEFISSQGFLFPHMENTTELYFYDDLGVGGIAHLAHCRVLFKAKRLLYLAYSKWQNEVVDVLPNGNIAPEEIMKFQRIGDVVLKDTGPNANSMLSRAEISAAKITIDPLQKPLLNGGKTDIQFAIQPYGFSHSITGKITISATI